MFWGYKIVIFSSDEKGRNVSFFYMFSQRIEFWNIKSILFYLKKYFFFNSFGYKGQSYSWKKRYYSFCVFIRKVFTQFLKITEWRITNNTRNLVISICIHKCSNSTHAPTPQSDWTDSSKRSQILKNNINIIFFIVA